MAKKLAKHIRELGIDDVWKTTRGAGVRVAVLDSGIWASSALPVTRVRSVSADGGAPQATNVSHGTSCASLVGSQKNGCEGAAPEANILGIQVTAPTGGVEPALVVKALDLALQERCDVISCSFTFATLGTHADALQKRLQDAHAAGVVVVAAAGNQPGMPAAFPELATEVLVVSAHNFNNAAQAVNFNARTNVFSLGEGHRVVDSGGVGAGWVGQTSGATALVAGVVALALSSVSSEKRRAVGQKLKALSEKTSSPLAGSTGAVRRRFQPLSFVMAAKSLS